MASPHQALVRRASAHDAGSVAALLHDFNVESGSPTPGVAALAPRIRRLMATEDIVVLLAGDPPVGVAQLTFRASVWSDGPTATLDELYVVAAHRRRGTGRALLTAGLELAARRGSGWFEVFTATGDTAARRLYEAAGLSNTDPGETDALLYYSREL